MQMTWFSLRLAAVGALAALVAGCSSNPATNPLHSTLGSLPGGQASQVANRPSLSEPALITINRNTGVLEAWPMQRGGGNDPQRISGPLGVGGGESMVANGHVLAITSDFPPEVVTYDLDTKTETALADPLGTPVDIAIDKNANLLVVNVGKTDNVGMYPAGSPNEKELDCAVMSVPEEIAVDNEGDVFINGYGPGNFQGVAEIPNGLHGPNPKRCAQLSLNSEPGYTAGLAVDPKTDDLIVFDDPDLCAGGIEGRMTVYHKPYKASTGRVRVLGGNCAGGLRLNADSTAIFYGDQDVSGSFSFIRQRSYPDGGAMGSYHGGIPSGFTTIPNTLPN